MAAALIQHFHRSPYKSKPGEPNYKLIRSIHHQVPITKDSNPMVLSGMDIRNFAVKAAMEWEGLNEDQRLDIHEWLDEAVNDEYLGPFVATIESPATSWPDKSLLAETYVLVKWALDDLQTEQRRVEKKEARILKRRRFVRKWQERITHWNTSADQIISTIGVETEKKQ